MDASNQHKEPSATYKVFEGFYELGKGTFQKPKGDYDMMSGHLSGLMLIGYTVISPITIPCAIAYDGYSFVKSVFQPKEK